MNQTYCHGVDEYVSDCNRLPFAESLGGRPAEGCTLFAFALGFIACGIVYGLCRLILSSFARAGQDWWERGGMP